MILPFDFKTMVDEHFYLANKEDIRVDVQNEQATFRFKEGESYQVETIHQHSHESWTAKFNSPLYILRGKGETGSVWYHLHTQLQSDFIALLNLFFHSGEDTYLSVDFYRYKDGSAVRLTDQDQRKWKSTLLEMKEEVIRSIIAVDPTCRLYFATQDIEEECYF